ncbi:MAG: Hsp20/alpha crystallin family protein [Cyclobacteriaceae bacterium]
MSNTFHRMGDSYNHYFDPDHFLGQDALSDIWDSRKNTEPMIIQEDLHINVSLPGFAKEEINVTPFPDKVKVMAAMTKENAKEIQDEYLVSELHMEAFDKTFAVPEGMDTTKLYTEYDGKTLKISIPYLPK